MSEDNNRDRSEEEEEEVKKDYASASSIGKDSQFPKLDFSMFIFSLNSSALVNLGVLDDPATGEKEKNIPVAKQTIDILGMLEEKTRGNLTKQEEDMLKHILYDLRMIYVRERG